jgi:hypothetical protein
VNFGLLEGGVQRATALRATAADLPLPELRRNVLAPRAAPLLSSYRGARYAAVVQAAASYPPLPHCPVAPMQATHTREPTPFAPTCATCACVQGRVSAQSPLQCCRRLADRSRPLRSRVAVTVP